MPETRSNRVVRFIVRNTLFVLVLAGCIVAFNFPYDVGPPSKGDALDESAAYYQDVYTRGEDGGDDAYIDIAQDAGHSSGITDSVTAFISRFGLANARTLEIGAGSGTLQDLTEDYTGLDIAESAARFFHKPFVQGSATELPFEESSFDVIWSVWTLEHVPDPELALEEMRRVVRDGGYIYLHPAWNNPTWASAPYLGIPADKIRTLDRLKLALTLTIQNNPVYRATHQSGTRLLRALAGVAMPPTRLRYHEMVPNYATYAYPDADAVNSIDCFEAALWFETRGDALLDGSLADGWTAECDGPVLIQINK